MTDGMNLPPTPSLVRRGSRTIIPALLLFTFAALAIASLRDEAPTIDEVDHLAAGYSYLSTGDFRFGPDHPPLMRMIAAAPLLFLGLKSVAESPAWQASDKPTFDREFLLHNWASPWRMLFLARLPMVALGVLTGLLAFVWGRQLWGYWPGVFVLFLYAFCPNVLAHTRLVTTDGGVMAFTLLTLFALWHYQRSGRLAWAAVCGVGLGGALLAKYSGLVTVVVVAVLLVLPLLIKRLSIDAWRAPRYAPPLRYARSASTQGGRYSGTTENPIPSAPSSPRRGRIEGLGCVYRQPPEREPDGGSPLDSRVRAALLAALVIVLVATALITLCYASPFGLARYYYGLQRLRAAWRPEARTKWSFLWGAHSPVGFWDYYLLAQLWKTPVPTLVLLGWAVATIVRVRARWLDAAFVLVPVATFHAAGMFSEVNIGIRHLLPAFPFMFLACGAVAWRLPRQRPLYTVLFGVLCAWYLVGTLRAFPYFISYFNELVGGPDNGIFYLDDSNIDWGQDVLRLKDYIEARPLGPVRFASFAPLSPAEYGIEAGPIGLRDLVWPQPGITYFVSADYLQRRALYGHNTAVRFEWLRRYRPVAKVGWSIFAYRFSTDAADAQNPEVIYIPRAQWYADAIAALDAILAQSPDFAEARTLRAAIEGKMNDE